MKSGGGPLYWNVVKQKHEARVVNRFPPVRMLVLVSLASLLAACGRGEATYMVGTLERDRRGDCLSCALM